MEWRLSHPEEYQGVASLLAFRNGLTADRRDAVRGFLVEASTAEDKDLLELECPEIHNGFYLRPSEGRPLREMFRVDLRDFDSDTPMPDSGMS